MTSSTPNAIQDLPYASFLIKSLHFTTCPGGGIGRHKGLKIPRPHGLAGSSPALGTIILPRKCEAILLDINEL